MKRRLATSLLPALLAALFLAPSPASANSIAGWGANIEGEFGSGFKGSLSSVPVYGNPLSGIKQLATSYVSGYALLEDGTIQGWGGNEVAQLANGTQDAQPTPAPIQGLPGPAVDVAAGGAHALALLADGSVWTWGGNYWGTLGNGTRNLNEGGVSTFYPIEVPGLVNVKQVAAAGGADAVVLGDGTVQAWGEDRGGQLGDGSQEAKPSPIQVKGLAHVARLDMGGAGSQGTTILATLEDGRVLALGQNNAGQTGTGSRANTVTTPTPVALSAIAQISTSASHTLALAGGQVYAWGNNLDDELHAATVESCKRPTAVPCSRTPLATGLSADEVSAGWRYSLVRQGGSLLAWGHNERGLLGIGTFSEAVATPTPVVGIGDAEAVHAGEYFSSALLEEEPPSGALAVTAGPGSLVLSWDSVGNGQRWNVTWRPVMHPKTIWSKPPVLLAPASRSYTVAGLTPARRYEVRLKQSGVAGYAIASGTPE